MRDGHESEHSPGPGLLTIIVDSQAASHIEELHVAPQLEQLDEELAGLSQSHFDHLDVGYLKTKQNAERRVRMSVETSERVKGSDRGD